MIKGHHTLLLRRLMSSTKKQKNNKVSPGEFNKTKSLQNVFVKRKKIVNIVFINVVERI